jgi:High potential iron-sulfur protein
MPFFIHRKPDRSHGSPRRAVLSRRQFFPRVLGAGAVFAAAFSLAKSEMARAQSKVKKAVAKYQDTPKNGQKCADCNFFRPPKACQLVEGDISPDGWCSFFAKKPA